MVERRPFESTETLLTTAREVWFSLTPADWQEAFADHPKIGDREALKQKFAETRHLATREQAGVDGAADEVLDALAAGNREYEERFGYIFIVCATGLTAEEMLARLRARLHNDPGTELRIAAEEQAKITDLRLRRLSIRNAS
jgi:2-oxo-4-hydroxy-4-carboxy-5-ureidoimidazoline decarboxylase